MPTEFYRDTDIPGLDKGVTCTPVHAAVLPDGAVVTAIYAVWGGTAYLTLRRFQPWSGTFSTLLGWMNPFSGASATPQKVAVTSDGWIVVAAIGSGSAYYEIFKPTTPGDFMEYEQAGITWTVSSSYFNGVVDLLFHKEGSEKFIHSLHSFRNTGSNLSRLYWYAAKITDGSTTVSAAFNEQLGGNASNTDIGGHAGGFGYNGGESAGLTPVVVAHGAPPRARQVFYRKSYSGGSWSTITSTTNPLENLYAYHRATYGYCTNIIYDKDNGVWYVAENGSVTTNANNQYTALWPITEQTPWDITKASHVSSFSVAGKDTTPAGVAFAPDGTKMIVLGNSNASVHRYDLSTPWDITSAAFVSSFSVAGKESGPYGVTFAPDGTKMFVVGNSSDSVHRYDLSTPWDITSSSFVSSFSVADKETSPLGVTFAPDGTKMFVIGDVSSDSVHRYDLSTPWDITSASHVSSFSVAEKEGSPADVTFSPDGTKMIVIGYSSDSVHRYDLSTPWDITSASHVSSFSVAGKDTIPAGVTFSPDGTMMFIVGSSSDSVHRYDFVVSAPSIGSLIGRAQLGGYAHDQELFLDADGNVRIANISSSQGVTSINVIDDPEQWGTLNMLNPTYMIRAFDFSIGEFATPTVLVAAGRLLAVGRSYGPGSTSDRVIPDEVGRPCVMMVGEEIVSVGGVAADISSVTGNDPGSTITVNITGDTGLRHVQVREKSSGIQRYEGWTTGNSVTLPARTLKAQTTHEARVRVGAGGWSAWYEFSTAGYDGGIYLYHDGQLKKVSDLEVTQS